MAELVDAQDLGSCVYDVGLRVPSGSPKWRVSAIKYGPVMELVDITDLKSVAKQREASSAFRATICGCDGIGIRSGLKNQRPQWIRGS